MDGKDPSPEIAIHALIEDDARHAVHARHARRTFLGGAAAVAAAATLLRSADAHAKPEADLAAVLPPGFAPFSAPGRVVKVKKSGCLEPNGLFPKADDAKEMLRRALEELTGKADLVDAARLFVSPQDKVCVKVNGIALQNMAAGVNVVWHTNHDATMDWRDIPGTQRHTKFVRSLTEATALVNFALIKDHSICGYTGALKNMTHGCSVNPQDFHDHHASPQIAILSAQDILRTRLRLCIIDGFKLMAHGGPLYKQPQYVVPHEAVYVSTDPVALDAIGWDLVEKARAGFHLKSLTEEGRPPAYIRAAADLGVGIADPKAITLREIVIA